jgi:hypothetical protein
MGSAPIAMRTPVRPDGVETTVVRMLDAGPTAELLIRALLRPYFRHLRHLFRPLGRGSWSGDARSSSLMAPWACSS